MRLAALPLATLPGALAALFVEGANARSGMGTSSASRSFVQAMTLSSLIVSDPGAERAIDGERSMRWLAVGIGLALAACSSNPAKQAEERYDRAHANGSAADRCASARAVKEAYQKAGNDSQAGTWRSKEEEECRTARLVGHGDPTVGLSADLGGSAAPQTGGAR